jgi:iron complex outermembrane recepter protein
MQLHHQRNATVLPQLRAVALAVLLACHGIAHAQEKSFDIPRQSLTSAIAEFERQSGLRVIRPEGSLAGETAAALQGRFEPADAVRRLLAGHPFELIARDGQWVLRRTAAEQTLPAVVVTARRAGERALDVPFSVSSTQGAELERRRLSTLEEALRDSVGVEVNSWGGYGDANVRMRGVGSLYQVSSEDSSVVVNVDGTPMSSWNASLSTLDVERVEVLKGPQGTLFGRNSEAGAINIITRRPTREADGYLRAEAGQEGQRLMEAAVGGALGSEWSGRLALRSQQADDTVINTQTNEPVMKAREFGLRGSLLWQPSATTSMLLSAEHQNQKDRIGMMLLRPYAEPPTVDFTPGAVGADVSNDRLSVELNHDLDGMQLTSHSSLQRRKEDQTTGADRVAAALVYGMPSEYLYQYKREQQAWNQDLRLSSRPGAPVFWVAGLNLYGSRRDIDNLVPGTTASLRDFDTHSEAAYGEATLPVTAALKITGGLRWTQERKDYAAQFLATGAPTTDDHRSLSDRYATGRMAATYALAPQTNLYAVLAHGHKAKGFQDSTSQIADGEPFKAARVNSLETGLKHESDDRRLSFTVAAFQNRVRDDHMLGYDYLTLSTKAINAATRSRGLETEGSWRALPGLTLKGGVVYTDAVITQSVSGVSGGDVASGNRVPDVPRWSGKLSAQWSQPLPGFLGLDSPRLDALLAYRVMSDRANDPQNHVFLPRFQKLDARLALSSGATEFYVWADNLQDKRYDQYVYYFMPGVTVGSPTRRRTLGLGLNWQFF